MAIRVIIGILLGYLIIAYFPFIIKKIHYFLFAAICFIAIYFLRAAPLLAEPVGFGLLIVILCYISYLLIKYKGNINSLIKNCKKNKIKMPIVTIKNHPQISALATITLYTVALTFISYIVILLIFVN